MTRSAQPIPMNYELNNEQNKQKLSSWEAMRALWPLLAGEGSSLAYAAAATVANSLITLIAPLLIAHVVDTYIIKKQFSGVVMFAIILAGLYVVSLATSYAQTRLMGN